MNNRFQPEMALRELIPLIGQAYIHYFTYRYGSELNDWPAAARRKYAHYYPACLPAGFKMESLLAVRSNMLSLFEDTEQAIDTFEDSEKRSDRSFWKIRRPDRSGVRKLNKLKHTPIGFVCRRGLDRYLIFRGTSAGIEWVQDSMLAQVPWRGPVGDLTLGGGVHRGFLQIYQNIIPHPNSLRLKRGFFSRKWGRLIISGHSLGGALASLAAFELNHLKPIVYTFASPRVFDPDFAAAYRRAI
ncbi:MAG: lipase family protein, partial [Leptospiraceae bacterium]|nr:lipase family protein [Leptospiraceae bacterium]